MVLEHNNNNNNNNKKIKNNTARFISFVSRNEALTKCLNFRNPYSKKLKEKKT